MSDDLDPVTPDELPDTEYDKSDEIDDLFDRKYDEVFLPDGSRLRPTSILDDPSDD